MQNDFDSLKQRILELEGKVALLDDIEALRRLRMTYHDYVNEGRWAEIADLFTPDATIDFGYVAIMKGREDIIEQFVDIPNHTDMLKQFIHNHVVEVGRQYRQGFFISRGEIRGQGREFICCWENNRSVRSS